MADSNIYQKGNFVQTLGNIEEGLPAMCFSSPNNMLFNPMLETPLEPMEFLSRSWSSSSIEVMQALSPNSQEKNRSIIAKPLSITAPSSSPQHAANENCRSPTVSRFMLHKFVGYIHHDYWHIVYTIVYRR